MSGSMMIGPDPHTCDECGGWLEYDMGHKPDCPTLAPSPPPDPPVTRSQLVRADGGGAPWKEAPMTPDIIALAREYHAHRQFFADSQIADVTLADALASAVLALACDRHPEAAVRCEACVRADGARKAGAVGGRSTSPAKAAAARESGKKGGRPRLTRRVTGRKKSLDRKPKRA